MRRASALLLSLAVAATGCSFSSVDPASDVHVEGRALDAAGTPLRNARVLLFKQADIGEVVFGSVLAVGTLSTICLLPDAPAICAKARTTRTDDDGRYAFDVKGSDTQGSLGTEATLNVVFSAGRGRTSTTVSFSAKDTDVALPDARLWNPRPRVQRPVRLTWSPLRGVGQVDYSALIYTADGASAIWSQPASGGAATLDPRILEDRPGSVAVGASTTLRGASGTGKVRASYLSERLPVGASAGTPPSRGRPCAPVTGTGPVRVGTFTGCGLTDGDLDAPAHLGGVGGTVAGGAVDLGRVRRVDLVVARGFAGQFLVELSSNGRTWAVVATSSGAAAAVPVPGGRSARYVRLRSPSGLDESLAYEISVW